MDQICPSREDGLRRLTMIQGQVRGIQRMVAEERPCLDVLTQIGAVREALRQVGITLLRSHLDTCVTAKVQEGSYGVYDELVDVINRFNR